MANAYVPDEHMLVSPTAHETERGYALGVCVLDLIKQDRALFGERLHPVAVFAGLFHFINEASQTDPAYARDLAFTARSVSSALAALVEAKAPR